MAQLGGKAARESSITGGLALAPASCAGLAAVAARIGLALTAIRDSEVASSALVSTSQGQIAFYLGGRLTDGGALTSCKSCAFAGCRVQRQ